MANFNITVPDKNFSALHETSIAPMVKALNDLKSKYSTVVDEVSTNSNVPSQLIYAMILVLSNGQNNTTFVSSDEHTRSGLFSLSNKVGKEILARERLNGRMNQAELDFLRGAGDENLKTYLGDEKPSGAPSGERWYKNASSGINRISRTSQVLPINWNNSKIAIQTGAIWIGQIWDKIAEQSKKPLDKVIITMTMPYGSQIQVGTEKFYIKKDSGGFLSGSAVVKHRPYNTDYTNSTKKKTLKGRILDIPKVWLPGGGVEDRSWEDGHFMGSGGGNVHFKGSAEINNPRGGSAVHAMKLIMAKGGILDQLTA